MICKGLSTKVLLFSTPEQIGRAARGLVPGGETPHQLAMQLVQIYEIVSRAPAPLGPVGQLLEFVCREKEVGFAFLSSPPAKVRSLT